MSGTYASVHSNAIKANVDEKRDNVQCKLTNTKVGFISTQHIYTNTQ